MTEVTSVLHHSSRQVIMIRINFSFFSPSPTKIFSLYRTEQDYLQQDQLVLHCSFHVYLEMKGHLEAELKTVYSILGLLMIKILVM